MKSALLVGKLLLFSVTLAGCAEITTVRSYPPESKLFINDQFVGVTPVRYRILSKELDQQYRIRIERVGYQPAEGMLQKDLCSGRTVANVFTLGILSLFKSSTCYVEVHDFSLSAIEPDGSASAAAPVSVGVRLQRLEKIRQEGVINEEEFRRYREQVLRDHE